MKEPDCNIMATFNLFKVLYGNYASSYSLTYPRNVKQMDEFSPKPMRGGWVWDSLNQSEAVVEAITSKMIV